MERTEWNGTHGMECERVSEQARRRAVSGWMGDETDRRTDGRTDGWPASRLTDRMNGSMGQLKAGLRGLAGQTHGGGAPVELADWPRPCPIDQRSSQLFCFYTRCLSMDQNATLPRPKLVETRRRAPGDLGLWAHDGDHRGQAPVVHRVPDASAPRPRFLFPVPSAFFFFFFFWARHVGSRTGRSICRSLEENALVKVIRGQHYH